jgi:hypothetical protein
LLGCRVTSAWRADGNAAAADDPVLQCLIADSDRAVAAKLVDLDSEQQLVSMIWGLEVRVCTSSGETLMRGRFEPAAFIDIWGRASSGQAGDTGAGATWQSVLTNLEWGDVSLSPFLLELKGRASSGLLSIKFNVDGYTMDFRSPEFNRGRIVGTIGPASADEPRHFLRGRQFVASQPGQINNCVAVVNTAAGKITLDLGNALQTDKPGGNLVNRGALTLGWILNNPDGSQSFQSIDTIPYTDSGWYEKTAGVANLPAARRLSDQELQALQQNLLGLEFTDATGNATATIGESALGLYVRSDQFVYRLEPGQTAEVKLYATQLGQPYANARVLSFLDPNQLQPGSQIGTAPPVGVPTEALNFPARIVTDKNGIAILPIAATNPKNPRGYIDGQVYGVRPALEETLAPAVGYQFALYNFISLLVFDEYHPDVPLTWYGAIEPIVQQAANLYPVMSRILNLGDYGSVRANRELLLMAFGLEVTNPNYMPVTRDLSPAKRRALLKWLADDPPLLGQPPAPSAAAAAAARGVQPQTAPAELAPVSDLEGSKTRAMSQRLGLRRGPR